LKKTLHKKRADGVAQGVDPDFKNQYHPKKKTQMFFRGPPNIMGIIPKIKGSRTELSVVVYTGTKNEKHLCSVSDTTGQVLMYSVRYSSLTFPHGLQCGPCVAPDLGEDGSWHHLSSSWIHMFSPFLLHLSPPKISLVLQNQPGHLGIDCQSCGRNELSPSPDRHHLVHDTGLAHSAENFLDSHYRRSHTCYCWWGCENERKTDE
jgi:hypothetical protein